MVSYNSAGRNAYGYSSYGAANAFDFLDNLVEYKIGEGNFDEDVAAAAEQQFNDSGFDEGDAGDQRKAITDFNPQETNYHTTVTSDVPAAAPFTPPSSTSNTLPNTASSPRAARNDGTLASTINPRATPGYVAVLNFENQVINTWPLGAELAGYSSIEGYVRNIQSHELLAVHHPLPGSTRGAESTRGKDGGEPSTKRRKTKRH